MLAAHNARLGHDSEVEDGDDAASDGEGSDGAVAKLAASRKKELIGEKKGLKGKLRDAQRAKNRIIQAPGEWANLAQKLFE